jgi:hypothetical protein
VTVQLYLNEGFEGGATTFLEEGWHGKKETDCVPVTGSVLIFEHHLLHQGSALIKGRKYCLRTDVMYDKPENVGKRRPGGTAGVSQDVAPSPATPDDAVAGGDDAAALM